jgi:hypothetical protein
VASAASRAARRLGRGCGRWRRAGAGAAHGAGEGRGPKVLGDEQGGGGAGLEGAGRLVDVGDLQAGDGAVLGLGQEGEVEDPDQAAVGQVEEMRHRLSGRLPSGPLDQHAIDRPHLSQVIVAQARSSLLTKFLDPVTLPRRCHL